MGGGQANSGQASTAAAQQTAANQQDMQISAQNAALQQRMVGTLFGNGSPGSTGTLSGMMNPANLNQKGLNSNYQTQFNEGKDQLAQSTAQQRGSLAQQFANSGATASSTPNGFMADQMNQLSRNQADTQGQMYSGLKGQQYSDALSNFWNANNLASGNAATGAGTSTAAAGNSGSSSASIYGTAGAYHPSQAGQIIGSALGAAGQVGAGMMTGGASTAAGAAAKCPRHGSLILMIDGEELPVEKLKEGDIVKGADGSPCVVESATPYAEMVLRIVTDDDCAVDVSSSHAMITPEGDFVIAFESIGRTVVTKHGSGKIIGVTFIGRAMVYDILTDGLHTYRANGIWAWGVRDKKSDDYLERPENYTKLLALEAR